ncbi:PREDICTED: solute carrier family 46 member 3-like [Papilio polytes]|uniref:solute carrier family 46 member 3-like n=1 Tax=Papilio polytes TaxID=76194 RepID=UPI00067670C2|nr:PREDICTED: solute carrier family 46 member 3-like [Papilio polytes]
MSQPQETTNNENTEAEFSETDPLKNKTKDEEQKETKSRKDTILNVVNNVSVEPTAFLFVLATILVLITTQNLSLEKACRVNLNYTSEICDSLRAQNMESQNEYERETQKLIASAMAWKTYLSATIPCVIALFVGSWSDRTGRRKVFIIYPLFGQILVCINALINTYFFHEIRLEYFVLFDGILEGIAGSWCVLFLVVFSYISAITSAENRTFRMGLVNFSMTAGFPIGMGISGIFLKTYGYYGCYGLACALHTTNVIYNLIFLKDTAVKKDQTMEGKGFRYFCKTFFDLSNLKETVKTVFKKGANHRRARVITFLAVVAMLFGPMYGEISILYISTRFRFNWDEVKFSIFQTYNFVAHSLGTIFSLTVFSKLLGWHDSLLGIISTVSKIMASFVYCFAPNQMIFALGPLVEILNGTSFLALRSLLSKMVADDEFGKINSLISLSETLMPLFYIPLYTRTYAATMDVLPGAVFLLGTVLTLPAVFVFLWLFFEHRRGLRKSRKDKIDNQLS